MYDFKENKDGIKFMLKTVKDHLIEHESNALPFIESLENYYIKNGKLSSKQMSALEKFYENVTNYIGD